MWRPEGWFRGGGYQDDVNGNYVDNEYTDLYEMGADAMLEALRYELAVDDEILAKCCRPGYDAYVIKFPTIKHIEGLGRTRKKNIKGKWVFIPDEVSQPNNGDKKESPSVRLHNQSA